MPKASQIKNQILELIQKTQREFAEKVNSVTSNTNVQRTTKLACDYGQKVASYLAHELKKQGELTAKETKKILDEANKKSVISKSKLQNALKSDSQKLLQLTKAILVNSIAIAKKSVDEKLKPATKKKRRKSTLR